MRSIELDETAFINEKQDQRLDHNQEENYACTRWHHFIELVNEILNFLVFYLILVNFVYL